MAALVDQALRAVTSAPLNLAEGAGRSGRDRLHHYRIACASADEASPAIRLAATPGALAQADATDALALLERAQAMTWRLTHPKD